MQMEDYYSWLISQSGLIAADTRLDVTGYSLGGQLATAFTMLHENVVNHTYIFNGVGLGEFNDQVGSLGDMIAEYKASLLTKAANTGEILSADIYDITADIQLVPTLTEGLPDLYDAESHLNASSEIFEKYQTKGARPLPGGTETTRELPEEISNKISQLYGHARHNDTEIVANQGINSSQEYEIFIEDQPNWIGDGDLLGLGGDFGDTHSIILLLDSLSLTEVFESIDPGLGRAQIEDIYAAASAEFATDTNVESNSLENALDALRRIFIDPDVSETSTSPRPDAFGDIAYREVFYENIQQLQSRIEEITVSWSQAATHTTDLD